MGYFTLGYDGMVLCVCVCVCVCAWISLDSWEQTHAASDMQIGNMFE